MWLKVDVSKNLYDGECQLLIQAKERYKVSYVKKIYFAKLSGGQHLFEILHTSSIVRASKNVVKKYMFLKISVVEGAIVFVNWRQGVNHLL